MRDLISQKGSLGEIWPQDLAQQIDAYSCKIDGDIGESLMEKAGWWVANKATSLARLDETILVIAGNGNNGADALVAARNLLAAGFKPRVVVLEATHTKHSQLRRLQEKKLAGQLSIETYKSGMFTDDKNSYLIIDGLLGLGLKGSLKTSLVKTCLEELSLIQHKRVLAIDLPSGLPVDAWDTDQAVLPADYTVTFGEKKPVHLFAPSRSACGSISCYALDFSFPSKFNHKKALYLNTQHLKYLSLWDNLVPSVHKYSRSHVLVIGGSPGRYGAPILSGLAAIKAGAGIVSVALTHNCSDILGRIPIELVAEDLYEDGRIDTDKLKKFITNKRPSSIVVGPGCMHSPLTSEVMAILQEASCKQKVFLVFDAGAMTNLESLLSRFPLDASRCLMTPHPGEWKRFGSSASELKSIEDLDTIRPKLSKLGVSLLYKTATPFSVFPDNSEFFAGVNISGDISLSKAGTGDILSGIAATVGSRDIPAWESGLFAYSWLSAASKRACSKLSMNGVSAVDILNALAAISR